VFLGFVFLIYFSFSRVFILFLAAFFRIILKTIFR